MSKIPRWWFQIFFMFTPTWGRFPIWLIFFRWVGSTTNQIPSNMSIANTCGPTCVLSRKGITMQEVLRVTLVTWSTTKNGGWWWWSRFTAPTGKKRRALQTPKPNSWDWLANNPLIRSAISWKRGIWRVPLRSIQWMKLSGDPCPLGDFFHVFANSWGKGWWTGKQMIACCAWKLLVGPRYDWLDDCVFL